MFDGNSCGILSRHPRAEPRHQPGRREKGRRQEPATGHHVRLRLRRDARIHAATLILAKSSWKELAVLRREHNRNAYLRPDARAG